MKPEASRRYLALFLPMLSSDRWRRDNTVADPGALVFIEKRKSAMRIVSTNQVAATLGLPVGMTLADARARVPDVQAVDQDDAADARLLALIADDCERYTPSVALDPPQGLILDITGCAHLWGNEVDLADHCAARLKRLGFVVELALAQTPDRARALARYREPLPVAALDLDDDAHTALRRAGLTTIDDLATRPRAALAARFGKVMVARLARVLGEEDARITPRRALPAITVLRRFAEPIARTEHVLEVIAGLVGQAGETLAERHQGGRRFAMRLFRSDGDVRLLTIETGAPTRDPALLDRLFRERIDALADPLDPGFGYDAIRLDVLLADGQPPEQIAADGNAVRTDDDAVALADRLGVRLGGRRIRRFAPGNSHIPELAGFTVPAAAPPLPLPWPEPERGEPPLRPLQLFDPPHPIEVMAEVPDGPPRRFRWRRRWHSIVAHEGPERIAPEWWQRKRGHQPGEAGLTRDYFRVEDEAGRRFWVFRHGLYGIEKPHPGWYLHGCFA